MKSPDFLCVGMPKAGTTWLFDNLRCHPRIWLPAVKSLEFLNGKAQKTRKKKIRQGIRNPFSFDWNLRSLSWNFKYACSRSTDLEWYQRMFRPAEHQICGEIAPSYCSMSNEEVGTVKRLFPDVKIIIWVRNPVDRMWSNVMHSLVRMQGRRFDTIDASEFIERFEHSTQRLRSDYGRLFDNWQSAFSDEQIHFEFFDDIRDYPLDVLRRICKFLEVEADSEYFSKTAHMISNKGPGHDPPAVVRQWLAREYAGAPKYLVERLGGRAVLWAEAAQLETDKAA